MGIIKELFEKRSFENQSWIQDWLRGRDSSSQSFTGISVTPDKALKYSAVLACSRVISEGIAGVPLITYKRVKNGRERATDHYLYDILHIRPNGDMTSFAFREMMTLHLLFYGNFYAEIVENGKGEVTALWPLLPWRMTVERENGILVYKYRLPDEREIIMPKESVLHIPGMSFDGLVGKSLISCAREAIGLGLALEEFGGRYFGQGSQFGGFIEHPRVLGDKAYANLKASLKEKFEGLSNAHRLMILEEGAKFNPNSIPPNDAQFIESRKFQKNEIAMIFNVSPHLIKDLDRATFNNIEHLSLEHVIYTLRPWAVRIEQSLSIQLLTEKERKLYFIEHLLEGLLRGDLKTRYEAYAIGKQWGWLNNRMIYELENINPTGPEDDIKFMPLNMIDITKPQETLRDINNQASARSLPKKEYRSAILKKRLSQSYKGMFEESTLRIIKFEKDNILKAATSIFKKRNIKALNFIEFLEQFYKDKYSEISKRIKPSIMTFGKVISEAVYDEIGHEIDKKELEKFMDEYSEAFNKRYIATSKNRLTNTVNKAIEEEGDIYRAIELKFDEFEKTRPETVSQKETIKVAGAVSLFAYGAAGVGSVMWINTGSKSCPFCTSLSGHVMGTGQSFVSKDGVMEAEGREPLSFSSNIMHPPLHNGCVCQIVAV